MFFINCLLFGFGWCILARIISFFFFKFLSFGFGWRTLARIIRFALFTATSASYRFARR